MLLEPHNIFTPVNKGACDVSHQGYDELEPKAYT